MVLNYDINRYNYQIYKFNLAKIIEISNMLQWLYMVYNIDKLFDLCYNIV